MTDLEKHISQPGRDKIVKELSDKLSKYETLHGTVFVKSDKPKT